MHFSNYISKAAAKKCLRNVAEVSVTPTALKQTPKENLKFLEENGIKIRIVNRRGRPRRLVEKDIRRILAIRRDSGLSFYRISRMLGIPKSTVFDYFRRYSTEELDGKYIEELKISEARSLFHQLMKSDIDDQIIALAKQGYESNDLAEIEEIMREIKELIFI